MNAPQNTNPNPTPTPANDLPDSGKRRLRLIVVSTILAVAGIGYGAYYSLVLSHYEQTDDAYAAGNVIQVTPQIAGTVTAIHGDDTELVESGKPLIEFDKTDAKVAQSQAEAQLAQTVREVKVLFANNSSLQAVLDTRSVDLDKARADLARRQAVAGSGAISAEELEHARNAVKQAEAALTTAKQQLLSNKALTDNTDVANHPNVQKAASHLREVLLNLSRTTIPAPQTGYIAKRAVQLGQRVAPGTPLLSVVPLNSLWVDANFKEVQLSKMRIGQDVTLRSDLYGDDVEFHGKVLGMSAGTGAAFALLPAQNASGNWIKVVQRVPVRISLDPKELSQHPLRVGVSMQVKVNIAQQQGAPVSAGAPARSGPAYQTSVFDKNEQQADQRIAQIIAANLNSAAPVTAKAK